MDINSREWKGLHEVSETVHLYNPSNGWLQNCNSTHTQLLESPKEENYLQAPDGESFRGIKCSSIK
jgi:acyl-homoserine lactone acylase PvdQ